MEEKRPKKIAEKVVEETKKTVEEKKPAKPAEKTAVKAKPEKQVEKKEIKVGETPKPQETTELNIPEGWSPKTELGKKVMAGEIKSIDAVLESGARIVEPEILDVLVPDLRNELILIGGRKGKGGGIQRIPVKITAAMHKSGRRFTTNAFVVVGNGDGLVGVGRGSATEARNAIAKATQKAKMNIIRVKRGCGSWECECDEEHSIRFKSTGRSGSVTINLIPAPKGIGLVANAETKKILKLAGIKDMWMRSSGKTATRINTINAVFDALKKLYVYEKGE